MPKRDIYKILLETFGNPTKLTILMLLTHSDKMTVTQMSKKVKVTKANLYHFVSQMVKDGMLAKPETQVKKNYVEKYYHLEPGFFQAIDPVEQRKRTKASSPSELQGILQSALLSLGLDLRILAEEVSNADTKTLNRLHEVVSEEKLTLSYTILHDKTYEAILPKLKEINRKVEEMEKDEKPILKGNRVVIIGLPMLQPDVD